MGAAVFEEDEMTLSLFGGEGVRGLTSDTFRLKEDSDDAIEDVRASTVTSAEEAADELPVRAPSLPAGRREVALLESGDEEREQGTTSTTLNVIIDEESGAIGGRDIFASADDVSAVRW